MLTSFNAFPSFQPSCVYGASQSIVNVLQEALVASLFARTRQQPPSLTRTGSLGAASSALGARRGTQALPDTAVLTKMLWSIDLKRVEQR